MLVYSHYLSIKDVNNVNLRRKIRILFVFFNQILLFSLVSFRSHFPFATQKVCLVHFITKDR